ncbi:hypothetical protein SAY86_002209 [Trapa natans]|uniref:ENT domain-containing protein n=1 Tax=Trapa natans TaxID=22666 RepID=A0AAN7LHF9_TRANT|nr:hypothetical protein SAY86_002209 [Trapa natans]
MDYGIPDSSGTDDDVPPPHGNRFQTGGQAGGSTLPMMVGVALLPIHGSMETQIHLIEQEAYCSVIRAFKAQSDAISWEKESLITELRKELRVLDGEHRELLSRVNADDTVQRIREQRKTNEPQLGMAGASQPVHDGLPIPTASASCKKQITSQSPALHRPMPQSSGELRRGPPVPLASSKKPKNFAHPPPPPGLAGRRHAVKSSFMGGFASNGHAKSRTPDPLVGKKVWTRWPDDYNFYEAVINNYNPVEDRHALVYGIDTTNETWEWVNLKEITPDDIRWEGEDAGVSCRAKGPGLGRGIKKSMLHGGSSAGPGRGRGRTMSQLEKDVPSSKKGMEKKTVEDIKILHTDKLLKEIERDIGSNHPDPAKIEKAKKALKDQEKALVDAIAKLVDQSDGESDNN